MAISPLLSPRTHSPRLLLHRGSQNGLHFLLPAEIPGDLSPLYQVHWNKGTDSTLLFSVCSFLSALFCLLFSVCSSLSVLLCLLFSVCSFLSALSCLIFSVCSSLSVLFCLFFSVRSSLSALLCPLFSVCCVFLSFHRFL